MIKLKVVENEKLKVLPYVRTNNYNLMHAQINCIFSAEIWWSHSARNLPAARGRFANYNMQESFCLLIAHYFINLIENVSRTTSRLLIKHSSELSRRVPILHHKASKRLKRKNKGRCLKMEADWRSIFHNLIFCLRFAVSVLRRIYLAKFTLAFSPQKKQNRLICFFFAKYRRIPFF